MNDTAKKCISIVLVNEGGYVNHPSDPGGETNFGIAKRFYPDIDIKNLTKEQATEIYYNNYWVPMRLHLINNIELMLQIFDMGVNSGPKTAIKLIQQHFLLKEDGIIGPITAGIINESLTVECYKKLRKDHYEKLIAKNSKLEVFRKGWFNRVDKTHL